MPGLQWLLDAPRLEATIIGGDGWPVQIVVPEPRTFALHKMWVARRPDRQALKRNRDMAQARIVVDLARTYLNQPLTAKAMPWLPADLKILIREFK